MDHIVFHDDTGHHILFVSKVLRKVVNHGLVRQFGQFQVVLCSCNSKPLIILFYNVIWYLISIKKVIPTRNYLFYWDQITLYGGWHHLRGIKCRNFLHQIPMRWCQPSDSKSLYSSDDLCFYLNEDSFFAVMNSIPSNAAYTARIDLYTSPLILN